MTDWEILNIEPTDDKAQIKAAYYRALPHYHPEEDPRGFSRLRESYERLMREKPGGNASGTEDTPVGRWMEQAAEAYEDFSRRIRPDTWLALLRDDVCLSPDSTEEAGKRLLTYFMGHCYVPHECLAVLERHFNWEEEAETLRNEFPEDFVDYILTHSKYPNHFRYSLFEAPEPGKNYDEFLAGYFRMQNLMQAGEYQSAGQMNEQLKQLQIRHPDYTLLQLRLALAGKNFGLAKELYDELAAWRPDDEATWNAQANYHMAVNEPAAAVPFYRKILAVNPEHAGALVGLGEAIQLMDPSRAVLEEALSYYRKAEDILPYDSYIHDCISSVLASLADYDKQACQERPEDGALRLHCARLLEETGQYSQGKALLETVPPEERGSLKYLLLMGDLEKGLEEWEAALGYYSRAVKLPGSSEQISLAYSGMGLCRMEQGRFEEALGLCEKGLALFPGNLRFLCRSAAALNKLERYQEALNVCSRGLSLCDQDSALARKLLPLFWHYKAEALYKTGDFEQALNACEEALSSVHNPETYLIQIRIYHDARQYERVLEIVGNMNAQGEMSSEAALYALKALRMLERFDEARRLAHQLMEQKPGGGDVEAEVYFQLALLEWGENQWDPEHLDRALELAKKSFAMTPEMTFKRYFIADIYQAKRDYRKSLAVYSSLLKQNPRDAFSCFKIAEMYHNLDDPKRAERYYRKVLEIDPGYHDVHCRLAGLLTEDIRYEEALEEIGLQLQLEQQALYFSEKSNILLKLGRKDEAAAILEQALAIYPSEGIVLTDLALIYKDDGRYREAADCLEEAIKGDSITVFVYEWLVECLKQLGDNKRREEVLNEGIEEFSQYYGLYYQRAELWRDTEQYEKMAEDGKRCIELADLSVSAYLETGDAYYLMGDHDEEAVSWYEKGIEKLPGAWALWQAMGLLYREHMGDYEKAVDCLEKALKYRTDPMYQIRDRRLILTQLIETCELLGDKGKLQKYVTFLLEILLERSVDEYDAGMFLQIGNCYLKLDKPLWAKPYLDRAGDEELCRRYAESSEEGLFDQGAIREELGQEKEALEFYQSALELCRYENQSDPGQCEKYEEAVSRLSGKKS